jgi:hypothetical protein
VPDSALRADDITGFLSHRLKCISLLSLLCHLPLSLRFPQEIRIGCRLRSDDFARSQQRDISPRPDVTRSPLSSVLLCISCARIWRPSIIHNATLYHHHKRRCPRRKSPPPRPPPGRSTLKRQPVSPALKLPPLLGCRKRRSQRAKIRRKAKAPPSNRARSSLSHPSSQRRPGRIHSTHLASMRGCRRNWLSCCEGSGRRTW